MKNLFVANEQSGSQTGLDNYSRKVGLGKVQDTTDGIELPGLRDKIPDIPPRADARELVAVMVPGLVENKGLDSGLAQMNTGFGAVINKEL